MQTLPSYDHYNLVANCKVRHIQYVAIYVGRGLQLLV